MAQATEIDLTNARAIEQGATYDELTLTWSDALGVPINITGYTVEMDIKTNAASTTPLATLSSTTGDFNIVGASGEIQFTFTSDVTAAFTFTRAVYDLFLIAGGGGEPARRIAYGQVRVIPRITTF